MTCKSRQFVPRTAWRSARFAVVAGVAALLPTTASAAGARAAKVAFDIPAGTAERTLKDFSLQSGLEVLFVTDAASGVKTNAVKGEFTAREAIDRLLAGTPLVTTQDERTGAVRARRSDVPNAPRAAPTGDRPGQNEKVEGAPVRHERFEVTGSRLARAEGEGFAPVIILSRRAIEYTGQSTLEGVLGRITQGNTSANSGDRPTFGDALARSTGLPDLGQSNWNQAGTSAVSLRGFDAQETLVLLNGRRMPVSPTSDSSAPFVNISGIPLSAIERIEILPSSASALYGAEAASGVINIILRDDFSGGDLVLSYGNTTSNDAAEKKVAGSFVVTRGRTKVLLSFSAFERAAQLNQDRWFTREIQRTAAELAAGSSASGASPGNVRSVPVGGRYANLPGLSSPIAAVPMNQNGLGLTPASFAATAGTINPTTPLLDYNAVVAPTNRYSVNLNVSHKFAPWLEGFVESGYSANRNLTVYNSYQRLVRVPANNPFNPFGVQVDVFWADPNTPPIETRTWIETRRLLVGLRGKFLENWDWEVGGLISNSDNNSTNRNAANTLKLNTANLGGAGTYNVFADERAFPNANSPARIGQFYYNQNFTGHSENRTYDAKLRGNVGKLPGGAVASALGVESRSDHYNNVRSDIPSGFTRANVARNIHAVYAEFVVPVFGEKLAFPLVRKLEFQLAGRNEEFSDFTHPARTYQTSLRWQPFKSLLLRTNYGTGFIPPPVTLLGATRHFSFATTFTDPLRRDESYTVPGADVLYGGNPGLRASTSKSLGIGGVFSPTFVPGLSLSADFSRIFNFDRFLSQPPSLQQNRGAILEFPERFTRETPSAGDAAAGLAGRIIQADLTAVNDGNYHTEALDFDVRYRLKRKFGDLVFDAKGTYLLLSHRQANSTVRYVNRRGVNGQPIWRGSTSVFAEAASWSGGLTLHYIGEYHFRVNQFTDVAETKEVDLFLSRKLPWWRLTATLAVSNLFDRNPPLRTDSAAGGRNIPGYSTYSDARLRFYTLTLRKQL